MNKILKFLSIFIAIIFLLVIIYLIYNILKLRKKEGVADIFNNASSGFEKVLGVSTFKLSDKVIPKKHSSEEDIPSEEEAINHHHLPHHHHHHHTHPHSYPNNPDDYVLETPIPEEEINSEEDPPVKHPPTMKCKKGQVPGILKMERKPESILKPAKNLSGDNFDIVLDKPYQSEEEDFLIPTKKPSSKNKCGRGKVEAKLEIKRKTSSKNKKDLSFDNYEIVAEVPSDSDTDIDTEDEKSQSNYSINEIGSKLDAINERLDKLNNDNKVIISESSCGSKDISEEILDEEEVSNSIPETNKIPETNNSYISISDYNSMYNESNNENHENKKKNEVYNIDQNIFSYDEAPLVCKALGGKLASANQIIQAHKKGANWCNYGWSQNQMGLFPIQTKFYNALQEGPEKYRKDCGKPGINGGFFKDKNIKLGVNCYGPKPDVNPDKLNNIMGEENSDCIGYRHNKELLDKYNIIKEKVRHNKIDILPFSHSKWSDGSCKTNTQSHTTEQPQKEEKERCESDKQDPRFIYDYETDDDDSNNAPLLYNYQQTPMPIQYDDDEDDYINDLPYDSSDINNDTYNIDDPPDEPPDLYDFDSDINVDIPSTTSSQSRICRKVR